MEQLIPLKKSRAADQIEAELKDLLISLFQEYLANDAHDCNVMGVPYLGSSQLIIKNLINANLAKFDTSKIQLENLKYLLMAWKYRNGKRGVHFLKTFITCTWGSEFTVSQLWQNRHDPYPQHLKTEAEISENQLDINDYYLTSRLRISLEQQDAKDFTVQLAKMLQNTLPARLFVTEIIRTLKISKAIYLYGEGSAHSFKVFDCTETLNRPKTVNSEIKMYGESCAYSFQYVQLEAINRTKKAYGNAGLTSRGTTQSVYLYDAYTTESI